MAIKDLEVRQGNVDIVVEVVEMGEIREFQKFGKSGRVANAKVKDESGEVKLSLWNEQIDQIKVGQKIHITNGYVNEFQGELQLTTGKFGKLEVVDGAEGGAEVASEAPVEAKVESSEEPKVDESQPSSSETETVEESIEEPVQ